MSEEMKSHRARAEESLRLAATSSLNEVSTQMKLLAIAELLMSVDDRLAELAKLATPPRLEIRYGDMKAAFGSGGAA